MRFIKWIAALGLLLITCTAVAQEKSPYIGRWKLNVAKSDYGQAANMKPKSGSLSITADTKASMKWHAAITDAEGKQQTYNFAGAKDGKPHPVTGDNPWKEAAYTEGADNALTADVTMKDGPSLKQEISVSGDTITVKNSGAENSTEVWERVKGAMAGGSMEKGKGKGPAEKGKAAPPQ